MGYERNPRGDYSQGGRGRGEQDFGRDYGSGGDYGYSSARDHAAAGQYGDRGRPQGYGRDRDDRDRGGYGQERYGARDYGTRDFGDRDAGRRDYGREYGGRPSWDDRDRGYPQGGYQGIGRGSYGSPRDYGREQSQYRGSYASDGHRFAEADRGRDQDDRPRSQGRPQGYDHDDRGFLNRAGDEIRSWFGDEEAERRREQDQRYDERQEQRSGRHDNDPHYHSWRSERVAEFDRDYDEYRRENATKFHNEFATWRTERQGQRDSLNRVREHMEVVGSDGEHVGTVDKVRGDRILLTKNDADAGGRHHSIPSRWIETIDEQVKIRKTGQEAKTHWRDEERSQATFGDDDRQQGAPASASGVTGMGASTVGTPSATGTTGQGDRDGSKGPGNLNRSFSGTY